MSDKPWFRFYNGVVDDPKVQRLRPELFKTWVNLLCIACRNDGALPGFEDLAFALRMDDATLSSQLGELIFVGLLDEVGTGLAPHNWSGRQYRGDQDVTAAERAKRYRDRKRDATNTVTRDASRNDTRLEQSRAESDTDSDPESDHGSTSQGKDRTLQEESPHLREGPARPVRFDLDAPFGDVELRGVA